MIGAFLSGRFSLGVGLERMVQFGTAVQLVGGLAGVALYAAGVVTVAGIVGPVVVFMIGTGLGLPRSEEHTSELQSLMRISYAVFCLKKKKNNQHKSHKQQKPTYKPHRTFYTTESYE